MGRPMHINRGLLFWGLALVTAGAVALAASQGWIDRDLLVEAWRLWPVILIAIGLSIVLSRTPLALLGTVIAALVVGIAGGAAFTAGPGVVSCGDGPATSETSSGDFTEAQATVGLDLNCGDLDVAMADGSSLAGGHRHQRGRPGRSWRPMAARSTFAPRAAASPSAANGRTGP